MFHALFYHSDGMVCRNETTTKRQQNDNKTFGKKYTAHTNFAQRMNPYRRRT